VSEGGSVPELRMTNFANKCVLIVDGTESGQDGDHHPGKDWRYDRQKSIVDFPWVKMYN
jgi:hypothetical protein